MDGTCRSLAFGVFSVAFLALGCSLANAKPARCFTTDDGHYRCDFKSLDGQGSFEISAPGRPTFQLWVEAPGSAAAFANFGDRNVALPGPYLRSEEDPACWANSDTGTRICAW